MKACLMNISYSLEGADEGLRNTAYYDCVFAHSDAAVADKFVECLTGSQERAFGAVQACFPAAGIDTQAAIDRLHLSCGLD